MVCKEEIKKFILKANDNVDGKLTRDKYVKFKDDEYPSMYEIRKEFNTWSKARKYSDIYSGYTKEEINEIVKNINEKVEGSLSQKEYKEYKKEKHPSFQIIISIYDSWDNAKRELGIEINENEIYSKEDCIKAMEEVNNMIKENLSINKYNVNKKDSHPSYYTITDKFENWNEAMEKAGFKVNKKASRNYSKEDCIKALKKANSLTEDLLSAPEYKELKQDSDPSVNSIRSNLGSCNKAKKEAGLKVKPNSYSKKDILNTIRRINEEIEGVISIKKYKNNRSKTDPSITCIRDKFKSWKKARDKVIK